LAFDRTEKGMKMELPTQQLKTAIGVVTVLGYRETMIGVQARIMLGGALHEIEARFYQHADRRWHCAHPDTPERHEIYMTRCDHKPVTLAAFRRVKDALEIDLRMWVGGGASRKFRDAARQYGAETEAMIAAYMREYRRRQAETRAAVDALLPDAHWTDADTLAVA
jgi:hypothetical protein